MRNELRGGLLTTGLSGRAEMRTPDEVTEEKPIAHWRSGGRPLIMPNCCTASAGKTRSNEGRAA